MAGSELSKVSISVAEETSDHALLEAWRQGNPHAADVLVQRYLARLTALARARLSHQLRRRVDPEDVVFSAWRSFFVAARTDRVAVTDDDNLWPLLLTFTLRKVTRVADYHTAQQRHPDHEVDFHWPEAVVAHDPTPEAAALVAEETEALLSQFEDRDRDILVRRLQGETIEQIAVATQLSDRTIRRVTERAREWLRSRQRLHIDEPIKSPDATTKPAPAMVFPTEIPRRSYRELMLEQWLGGGGFGKVYRARDRLTGETVAVKFLRKVWWDDGTATASLLHEATILRRLSDARVALCRGWGRTPHGAVFLVLDWIAGETLTNWRLRISPSISEICRVVMKAAEIVAAVHEHGILHGDLKPDNILRTVDGRVVLTDFGMARRITPTGWEVPRGGTAGFLAPEQCSEAFGPITARTDVYGLGALLYALFTGEPPHAGRNVPEILSRVISGQPVAKLTSRVARISPKLDDFLSRCLSKVPTDRPDSADQFLAELHFLTDS